MRAVVAERAVAAPRAAVFRFLADIANHAGLAPGAVDVLAAERRDRSAAGALVRLRGPLGIRRTATTELFARPPGYVAGRAKVGRRTMVAVEWTIESRPGGSSVELCAWVEAAGPIDWLLLRLGGLVWLDGRFDAALDRLAEEMATAPAGGRRSHPVRERAVSAAASPVGT